MRAVRTVKEVVRDLIAKAGLGPLHLSIRKLSGENVDHLFLSSLPERFSAVYENHVWLNGRSSGSLSGLGSEVERTQDLRQELVRLLESLHTRTLLDVGCGDFLWMKEVALPENYIGVDIVADLVKSNNSLHGSAERTFQSLDATWEPLPLADTVLCREVLFHLSLGDIWRLIGNIRRSASLFFIATNDNDINYNAEILSGDFRLLNLHKRPFFFPTPLRTIPDNSVSPHRTLSVWKVADLPELPANPMTR